MSGAAACALGVRQPVLDRETAAFFRAARPWGFILFARACETREQVRALCAALREAAGHDALVWIDQEGGRVARLTAPHWPTFPPALAYGDLYRRDREAGLEACALGHRLIAASLREIGVDGDFAPVLDRPAPGADPIIGDRAYGSEPGEIAALGRAALEGLHAGGVVGCIKHIPGHGRADADSHLALPRVTADRAALALDIAPFAALADAPAAMTAHIVYDALDPAAPATCSPGVIEGVIRGEIGFQGLLMSDDLDMQALSHAVAGGLKERAEAAFGAGCDLVLQCSGALADMEATLTGCPTLAGLPLVRARAAEAFAKRPPLAFDAALAWARFQALMRTDLIA